MISLIAAIGRNRELGRDNKLLWHIPGDLPRFKNLTIGHPVIMGRKTFESIGKPLTGRTNIVVTSKPSIPGIIVAHSIEEALEVATKSPGAEEVFIIGGGKIFEQTIDRADRLYLTVVDSEAAADVYFPDYSQFTRVVSEDLQKEEGLRFSYQVLAR